MRTNLTAGRIRLLFVADRIPSELRRIVEFLNRQMQPAEVLAIELRQYEGQGLKTLVPIVLGQTQDAIQKKGTANRPALPKRAWTEDSLLADMESRAEPAVVEAARKLISWINRNADRVDFNSNPRWGSMMPEFQVGTVTVPGPFRIWTDGAINFTFQYLVGRPIFGEISRREELRRRLNEIDGIALGEDTISKRPQLRLAVLTVPDAMDSFLGVMDWFVAELRRVSPLQAETVEGLAGT